MVVQLAYFRKVSRCSFDGVPNNDVQSKFSRIPFCRTMKNLSERDLLGELLTCDPQLITSEVQSFYDDAIYVRYEPS